MNVVGCRCAVKRTLRLGSRQIWTPNRNRILSSAISIFRVHEHEVKPSGSALPLNFVNLNVIARHKSDEKDLSLLFKPLPFFTNENSDDTNDNVGAELTGQIRKENLLRILNQFYRRKEVKKLAAENGLDNRLFHRAYLGFRKFCVDSETLPVDLHVIMSDILQEAGHVEDILPFFLRYAKEIFPHLDCMDDLKKISDLRLPANWYPEARAIERKIVFHAGPTNSGKTYHALERFLVAESGIYCGPLKLLAQEVYHKSNQAGTACDLVTGEERRYAADEENPSSHVACTVEMASSVTHYEVAVIDEIQMLKDPQRGWAWTRALLGLCAKEIHVCGEAAAIDMVKELMLSTGDEVEVRKYKRLTKLMYSDRALANLDDVRPGDCFVCFSKKDIYHISRQLEKRGHTCAVIYGGLPPGTKLAQAQKFNDPDDPCKVMVATDAIGMGLNLSIKRIIFYSLIKPHLNRNGEKEMDLLSTSQALQIGGRAGRFNTQFQDGEVTTFRSDDLQILKDITSRRIEPIEQAGLHPTAEQIELFAFHLPKATLSNLIDIFVTLSELDNDKYFMCNVDDFKFLADLIEQVPLPLRARYVLCCSPIPKKQPFVCTMFLKFARQFSRGEPLTIDWLCRQVGWPLQAPVTIMDLVHLEGVFDVLDLYLWLSYRFMDMFPDAVHVRDMQQELDKIIQLGVFNITQLLKKSETNYLIGPTDNEDNSDNKKQERRLQRGRLPDTDSDLDPVEKPLVEKSLAHRIKMAKAVKAAKMPTGQVTQELIKQGLLTPELVDKLQKEWSEQFEKDKS